VFLLAVGGIIVAAVGAAAIYDHRAKRRGWRVSASTEEAFHNRLDVEALKHGGPPLQGVSQEWMTYRRRDQKP
jgi:hypothetical protein